MSEILNIPNHIAIIPDGNRRWAKKKMLAPWIGHRKGSEILDELVDVLVKYDITHMTFWGSSKDNMTKRAKEEVKYLLEIFKNQFAELAENEKIHKNQMRINVIGSWREQFPEDVKKSIEKAIDETKNYSKFFINFMIAYSGTDEIISAVKNIVEEKKESTEINKENFKDFLLTKNMPSVDLLVRTGGEPHNSDGFMMWETANSQLYFSDKLWPDFTKEDLEESIKEYSRRERRLGK